MTTDDQALADCLRRLDSDERYGIELLKAHARDTDQIEYHRTVRAWDDAS